MTTVLEHQNPLLDRIAGTQGPHFAWFCSEFLEHSIGEFDGLPVDLEGWQTRICDEALTLLTDNAYLWLSCVIVLPRKNGKTTLLGAYALYRLLFEDGSPEILLAASSNDQAGRLFNAAAAFVRRSSWLQERLVVRQYIGEIARRDGEGVILRMSASPERLHGYNPSLVICDEVAQWVTPTLRAAWAALTTGGGARKRTQVFTITTAGEGHQRPSSILGQMVDRNEASGDVERRGSCTISRNYTGRTLVFNYAAKTNDVTDLDAIREANPASWVTTEFLARQAANPELTKAQFLQLHACVWAESDSQYMPADRWATLARAGSKLEPGDMIALGFDGSKLWDATALVAVRLSDLLIVPLAVWERPFGMEGESWEVPRGEVDDAIDEAMRTYNVTRFYGDDKYWESDLQRWRLRYGKRITAWPTSSKTKMSAALRRFRTDAFTTDPDGSPIFGHQGAGEDAPEFSRTLTRHIVAAQVETSGGNQQKLIKPGKRIEDRIDVAMAAILGYLAARDSIAAGALTRRKKRKTRLLGK